MEQIERLDSWKEISEYVRRDVGTCIKWARCYGLPVHHIDKESPRSRVFAFKTELDDWFLSRSR
ncbi:MAG: domain protein beta Propeller [Candidatus Aminicenantes bacterium]|nr:domain protein beta Propeller [Candidatus Aminicenantes bacterium]